MTHYLLDTGILANAIKATPSPALTAWMADQADEDLFISSLTLAEIRRAILDKPAGKKRKQLEAWFAGPEGPPALFAGRILPFDDRAALVWAQLISDPAAQTNPETDPASATVTALDTVVAAIALTHNCVLVTDNESHFAALQTLNPMRIATPS